MGIRTKVAAERYKRDWSLTDVAERCNCRRALINTIENRRTYAPPRVWKELCRIYRKSRRSLFDEDGVALRVDI